MCLTAAAACGPLGEKWLNIIFNRLADEFLGEDCFFICCEFAEIFLPKPTVPHDAAVTGEVRGENARAVRSGDFDAAPRGAGVDPSVIEKSTASEGRGGEPDVAAADGEDGAHGET